MIDIETQELDRQAAMDGPERIANASLHQRAALMAEIERLRTALQNISIGGIGERNWTIDEMRAYALHEYQHNNEGANHHG